MATKKKPVKKKSFSLGSMSKKKREDFMKKPKAERERIIKELKAKTRKKK